MSIVKNIEVPTGNIRKNHMRKCNFERSNAGMRI